ncbi:uncharacterized protein RCO7_07718 [Rhynchosporium graminicola]|uniref:Uncharacterized protein n=2 Tax=Rhynchosporium TaxID=38037 RepID=A0A1E1MJI8_RHYSE|nr:uncharacterized protein RCO7_07718 [Rhynchosporium commune]CZT49232.1 uncharacterized protein RSE6_16096 [Rhynchosporium secalis]
MSGKPSKTNRSSTQESAHDYQQQRGNQGYEIIKEDARVEHWVQTRRPPPHERPPPLSEDVIKKLEDIPGLEIVNRD